MTIARCCVENCAWELDCADSEMAHRTLNMHATIRHPVAPSTVSGDIPQLATIDWRTQALDAISRLAEENLATGQPFTLYEISRFGIEEPPDYKTSFGGLARDAHHLGLIEPVGFTESKRPGTKGSAVKTWQAGPAVRNQRHNVGRTA